MFGPFHSSRFFWKVFVCLPSSHSLCTAFTKTQSALPIDVSGVRSAKPCVCHHRVVQAGSIQQLRVSCGIALRSRPLPQEQRQPCSDGSSDLPLLKLDVSAGRRGGQETVPWGAVCCCCGHHIPGAWGEWV